MACRSRPSCQHAPMRVVITGAAGRIGRCLMGGLREAGHEVQGIDVVPGDDIVVADLASDVDALSALLAGTGAVVHLAAIAAETDFATAVETHIGLTQRVLEAAVAYGVPRVVYASSNHAVGFTPRAPAGGRRHAGPAGQLLRLRQGRVRGTVQLVPRPPRRSASPACASAASATARRRAVTSRPGSRPVTPCASSTPAWALLTWAFPSSTASRATPGRGGTSDLREHSGTSRGTMPRHGRSRSNERLRQRRTSSMIECSEATSPARSDARSGLSVVQTVDLVIVSS